MVLENTPIPRFGGGATVTLPCPVVPLNAKLPAPVTAGPVDLMITYNVPLGGLESVAETTWEGGVLAFGEGAAYVREFVLRENTGGSSASALEITTLPNKTTPTDSRRIQTLVFGSMCFLTLRVGGAKYAADFVTKHLTKHRNCVMMLTRSGLNSAKAQPASLARYSCSSTRSPRCALK
jgi:hypothetical protein